MDDLIAIVLIAFLVGMILIVLLVYRLAFHELKLQYEHRQKMATGNFKMTLPAKVWDEAVQKGVFALAIKDAKTGEVAFTCTVERQDAKT